MYLLPHQVDRRLGWKPGRSERLAKQRRLPHYVLPDGAIRFLWEDLEPCIVRVPEVMAAEVAQ